MFRRKFTSFYRIGKKVVNPERTFPTLNAIFHSLMGKTIFRSDTTFFSNLILSKLNWICIVIREKKNSCESIKTPWWDFSRYFLWNLYLKCETIFLLLSLMCRLVMEFRLFLIWRLAIAIAIEASIICQAFRFCRSPLLLLSLSLCSVLM
jgi:hypothetical protein